MQEGRKTTLKHQKGYANACGHQMTETTWNWGSGEERSWEILVGYVLAAAPFPFCLPLPCSSCSYIIVLWLASRLSIFPSPPSISSPAKTVTWLGDAAAASSTQWLVAGPSSGPADWENCPGLDVDWPSSIQRVLEWVYSSWTHLVTLSLSLILGKQSMQGQCNDFGIGAVRRRASIYV